MYDFEKPNQLNAGSFPFLFCREEDVDDDDDVDEKTVTALLFNCRRAL